MPPLRQLFIVIHTESFLLVKFKTEIRDLDSFEQTKIHIYNPGRIRDILASSTEKSPSIFLADYIKANLGIVGRIQHPIPLLKKILLSN